MLDMDNTISHLDSTNKNLRAQIEQLEQEKSQLQASGAAIEETEAPKGLNQELIDSQIMYEAAATSKAQADILNANEAEDECHFEPLIQFKDKDDNEEFQSEEVDHK